MYSRERAQSDAAWENQLLSEHVSSQLREQQLEEELMKLALENAGSFRSKRGARRRLVRSAYASSAAAPPGDTTRIRFVATGFPSASRAITFVVPNVRPITRMILSL